MDYEKMYKETLERVKIWQEHLNEAGDKDFADELNYIFPELKESEDEKIRKMIINQMERWHKAALENNAVQDIKDSADAITWLEKQGEYDIDCPKNHQDSSRPNGCIVLEDFNGGEGFYKLNLDYLNKKQVEEVEEMVRTWNKESKTSNENIKNCIGMCLTDVNEQRFKDYNTNLRDCLAWLEKQGEQNPIDKVEPKFHEGDWLCENELNNYARFIQILEIINIQGKERYRISRDIRNNEDIVEFGFLEKYYHKFDIKDAKDGDVLTTPNYIYIFNSIDKETETVAYYCLMKKTDKHFSFGDSEIHNESLNSIPATKEQRDLLSQKMHEAGYTFDFEKKELKKIDNEEVNGEDYGIDGLWHAQRILEKTLGEVDGYQTDDGILDHKAAITAVKKLYEQKPAAWSEEDERAFYHVLSVLEEYGEEHPSNSKFVCNWLKSIKARMGGDKV